MVINQPTMEGPKKPPRLPQPLIRPLAPPATSRGNNIGGMLQNTPLCACWKNPTPTRNAYDTQIISLCLGGHKEANSKTKYRKRSTYPSVSATVRPGGKYVQPADRRNVGHS